MEAQGHCFYHCYAAANMCLTIAPNRKIAELAWVAAMLHNIDHIFGKNVVQWYINRYLDLTPLCKPERAIILDAVLKHGDFNYSTDGIVLRVLKDADMIVNMGLTVAMRSARFRPTTPLFNPRFLMRRDPSATFKEPGTILQNLNHVLAWWEDGWIRLPKSKPIARRRYKALRAYVNELTRQLVEEGLLRPKFPKKLIVT